MTTDRLGQIQDTVATRGHVLVDAAELLERVSPMLDAQADAPGTNPAPALAAELLALRRTLWDLLELSLPEEVRDRLRGAFTAVGILDPEDRRALAELVADRKISSLADLTTGEAEQLFIEIRAKEEPF